MILEFSFSNFGPVNNEVTLSFEATNDETLENYYVSQQQDGTRILKLGMIYGPNASGKTTILNAIQTLRDLVLKPLEQKGEPIKYRKHLLNNAEEKDSKFNLVFYLDEIKYDYTIILNNEFIRKEILNYYPKNHKALFFERYFDGEVSNIKFGSTLDEIKSRDAKRLEANTIRNVTVLGSYTKTNVSIPFFNSLINWFDDNLMPIISPSDQGNLFSWTSAILDQGKINKETVIEILKKADLNISGLDIIEDEIVLDEKMMESIENLPINEEAREEIKKSKKIRSVDVEFLHEFEGMDSNKSYMRLKDEYESNGTRRYYQLTGPILMAIKANAFLFIDELESSLHPDLQEHLIMNFLENSKESQLLFTTHNTSLLLQRDLLRNDTIWFTEKDKFGATDLFSLADFKSDQIRNTSSIFNAYALGKVGAKPKVSTVRFGDG